jgi:hypothetical protein
MATSSRGKAIADNISKIKKTKTAAVLRRVSQRVEGVPF